MPKEILKRSIRILKEGLEKNKIKLINKRLTT
jgi:hypothetical protein